MPVWKFVEGRSILKCELSEDDRTQIKMLIDRLRNNRRNNPKSISNEISEYLFSESIMPDETIIRFSKWCHWDDVSEYDAQNLSRYLFNGIVPKRMADSNGSKVFNWRELLDEFKRQVLGSNINENVIDENHNEIEVNSMNAETISLNTILYGPPGTGKTYSTKRESERIINSNYEKAFGNQIEFVTFHPSYSYEDFVEGIRPVIKEDNQGAQFEYHCGIFKEICLKAFQSFDPKFDWNMLQTEEYKKVVNEVKDIADKYVLIIDEINRGDISKILGELITLIEPDKRFGCENSLVVRLPYTKQLFAIPPNLYILGTMNTADRSLALIDIALRRRFDFMEMKPDFSLVPNSLSHHTIVAKKLNDILGRDPDIGKDKKIGHAFFFNTDGNIRNVWIKKIWPLLEEYYYFDRNKLVEISGGAYTIENGWNEENIESFLAKYR